MEYTERAQGLETQDPKKELMKLYNRGDMPEHPGMLIREAEKRILPTHDSDVWRV